MARVRLTGIADRLSLPLKDCLKGVGVEIEFIARVSGILIERAMLELPIQLSPLRDTRLRFQAKRVNSEDERDNDDDDDDDASHRN